MNKTLLLFSLLLTAGTLFAQNAPQQAAGNYSGVLYINLGAPVDENSLPMVERDDEGNDVTDSEGNPVYTTYNVAIEEQTESTVKFGLYNFGFLGLELGDIVLNDIPVSVDGEGKVVFGENAPATFSFLGGAIMATAKINEAGSYVKGDEAIIDVDVVWTNVDPSVDPDDASDDMPIYVRFSGNDAAKASVVLPKTRTAASGIYDLQGRRQRQAEGISIVDGRKVMH